MVFNADGVVAHKGGSHVGVVVLFSGSLIAYYEDGRPNEAVGDVPQRDRTTPGLCYEYNRLGFLFT